MLVKPWLQSTDYWAQPRRSRKWMSGQLPIKSGLEANSLREQKDCKSSRWCLVGPAEHERKSKSDVSFQCYAWGNQSGSTSSNFFILKRPSAYCTTCGRMTFFLHRRNGQCLARWATLLHSWNSCATPCKKQSPIGCSNLDHMESWHSDHIILLESNLARWKKAFPIQILSTFGHVWR